MALSKFPIWSGLLAIAITFAGLAWLWSPQPRMAPPVSFITLDGKRTPLASLLGGPVLVTFWATSCPTCVRDIPEFSDLHRELSPRGLNVVAVAMPYDPPNRVLEMARERRLPYRIALDVQGEVLSAFGDVPGTPTTYLIDSTGRVVERHAGPLDFQALKTRIMAMFEKVRGDSHGGQYGENSA